MSSPGIGFLIILLLLIIFTNLSACADTAVAFFPISCACFVKGSWILLTAPPIFILIVFVAFALVVAFFAIFIIAVAFFDKVSAIAFAVAVPVFLAKAVAVFALAVAVFATASAFFTFLAVSMAFWEGIVITPFFNPLNLGLNLAETFPESFPNTFIAFPVPFNIKYSAPIWAKASVGLVLINFPNCSPSLFIVDGISRSCLGLVAKE